MKRYLLASLALFGLTRAAEAHFIDGYIAECTAVTTTSCTEPSYTNYGRQPVYFNTPANNGYLASALRFQFASPSAGLTFTGRAIFDAPTGGRLLMVIPATFTPPYPGDVGETGSVSFTLSNSTGLLGDAISATYATGATLGTMSSGSLVTTGTNVSVSRGVLQGAVIPSDPFYVQTAAQTAGFSYSAPTGTQTLQINGAATLATGTVVLPTPLADGQIFRLTCAITVTALTLTPPSGYTWTGTAPASCGANATHEWLYFAASHTVVNLF
jgi:hypothetical protein